MTAPQTENAVPEKKTWSIGTLVYDRKALTILFVLLLIGDLVWALRARTLGPIAQLLLIKGIIQHAQKIPNIMLMIISAGTLTELIGRFFFAEEIVACLLIS